jgi:hypothetical protein
MILHTFFITQLVELRTMSARLLERMAPCTRADYDPLNFHCQICKPVELIRYQPHCNVPPVACVTISNSFL